MPVGCETKKVSLTLSEEVWRKVDTEADFLSMSRSGYLSHLVQSVFRMAGVSVNGVSPAMMSARKIHVVEALTTESLGGKGRE